MELLTRNYNLISKEAKLQLALKCEIKLRANTNQHQDQPTGFELTNKNSRIAIGMRRELKTLNEIV